MPKYMFQASYTAEGAKGLMQQGGSGRRAAIEKVAESVGGKVESVYFAFGHDDAYVICDLPDNQAATAVSLAVGASGKAKGRTIVLLTPEEVDEAVQRSIDYSPPGS